MQSPRHMPKQRIQKAAEPQTQQNTVVNEQPAKAASESSPILALQKHIGNQAAQRLLIQGKRSGVLPAKAALQAKHNPLLQRTPTGENPAPTNTNESSLEPGSQLLIDGQLVGTVDEGINWYNKRIDALEKQISEFQDQGEAPPEILNTVIEKGDQLVEQLYASDATMMPDSGIDALADWGDEYTAAMKQADQQIENIAIGRMREMQRKIQEILDNIKQLEPKMRDLQRSAFRKGSEDTLTNVANTFALYLDSSLVAKDWLETATTTMKDVKYLGTTLRAQKAMHDIPISWEDTMVQSRNSRVVKFLDAADKLNKAFATFQLLSGALDLLGGQKTKSDIGSKGVSYATTVASAGGTLLGASAFFGLYNNFYIGPMVSKILSQLEVLKDLLSTEQNHPLIQLGYLDLVNWDIEPGGREMFDYMMKVMKATSALEVPAPSGDVLEYFDDNEDDFNAGAMGKDDLPTEGLIFTSVKGSDAKYWIYKHRADVWGMLYGSMPVPK